MDREPKGLQYIGLQKASITERLTLSGFSFFMCICIHAFKNIYLFGCVES